jgi:hypothetical protein
MSLSFASIIFCCEGTAARVSASQQQVEQIRVAKTTNGRGLGPESMKARMLVQDCSAAEAMSGMSCNCCASQSLAILKR